MAKRRPSGDGMVRRREDGRWEGRYPVYSVEKGKQVYRSVYGGTYDETREKLAIKKNMLKNGKIINDMEKKSQTQILLKNIMLTDMLQEWLAEVKAKRKPSTYVKYSLICHNHLENNFRNITVAEITDSLVRERISGALSESLQKNIYCVLNQVLKYTSIQYSVKLSSLEKPVRETKNRTVKVLSQKEQKTLISVLYQEMNPFKTAILLCLFTGLRLGELCALKWEDIDFENEILTVSRTVQRLYVDGHKNKTALVETAPKSECSRREIPLTDSVLELLLKFESDKEYILGGDKPMEPRTMQYHFKKILKDINLQKQNFHVLRHTFSTNCIEGGVDVKSLSEMLGHSDVKITLNRYVHPSMDTKRQYMNILSGFYGQIYGQTE